MKLNLTDYQKLNRLQEKAFVQLKNGETGDPEFTDSGEKIGFTLYSGASEKYKRAVRATAHLDLSKKEKDRKKEIELAAEKGQSPSADDLDFLEQCDKKTVRRFQFIYSMVIDSIHHIELDNETAESIGVKIDKKGTIVCEPENLHALFIAAPDLSGQIGDAINTMSNFTKS